MIIKRLLYLFAILAMPLAAVSENAFGDLVIVFEGNHQGSGAITNGESGTITFDFATGAGTTNASYGYTISDIDAAGDGTANDSLTISFGVTSAGGNVTFQNDGNFGVSGNTVGNLNAATESLTFSLVSSSLTLGNPGTGSVTGGGFNRIAFTQLGAGETALLSGGTTSDGSVTGPTTFSPISSFTIGHNGDGSNFRVGPARYRFVITASAVPEPTTMWMVGSFLAVSIVRRRRSV